MSTPGQFRFPIRSADIWGLNDEEKRPDEDIAADLDYQDNSIELFLSDVTSSGNVPTFGASMDRGRSTATFSGAAVYTTSVSFEATFTATPRVVVTVECGRGQEITPILTSVTTGGFSYRLTNASTLSTATSFVHWVAVAQ
jgi:hypothetical protein